MGPKVWGHPLAVPVDALAAPAMAVWRLVRRVHVLTRASVARTRAYVLTGKVSEGKSL